MQLRHLLQAAERAELERLTRRHRLEATGDRKTLIRQLVSHLTDRDRVVSILSALDGGPTELLTQLAARGGEVVDRDLIRDLYGGDETAFRADLRATRDPGLVYLDGSGLASLGWQLVVLPTPLLRFVHVPLSLTDGLAAALRGLSIPRLVQCCEDLEIPVDHRNRHVLIKRIQDHLRDPERLRAYVERLSREERMILDHLLAVGGRQAEPRVARRFHLSGYYRYHLNHLLHRPLLFSEYVHDASSRSAVQFLYVPGDLARRLRPSSTRATRRFMGRQKGDQVVGRPGWLARDVAVLLGAAEAGWLRIPKRGGIPRRAARRLGHVMKACEEVRPVEFLHRLAMEAGYLEERGGRWRVSSLGERALSSPILLERAMLSRWLEGSDDLEGLGDTFLGEWVTPRDLRRWVVAALEDCVPGEDVPFAALYDRALHNRVDPPPGPADRYRSRDGPDEQSLARFRGVVQLLTENLVWLGIVEVGNPGSFLAVGPAGRGRPSPTPFLGLTSSGARWIRHPAKIGAEDAPPRRDGQEVILMPNLEILAPPELRSDLLLKLCRFADPVRSDAVLAMQVSPQTIRRGLDGGTGSRQILDLLDRHARGGVPDTLRRLIQDTGSRHGEIRLGEAGGYLSVRDPLLLTEILARPRFAERVLHRVGDRLVVLRRGTDLEDLLQDLRREGYLPVREEGR